MPFLFVLYLKNICPFHCRYYCGLVSCAFPVRRVECSSRGCWRTWGPILLCWTCCRSPMRRWGTTITANWIAHPTCIIDSWSLCLIFSLITFTLICLVLPLHRVMRRWMRSWPWHIHFCRISAEEILRTKFCYINTWTSSSLQGCVDMTLPYLSLLDVSYIRDVLSSRVHRSISRISLQ